MACFKDSENKDDPTSLLEEFIKHIVETADDKSYGVGGVYYHYLSCIRAYAIQLQGYMKEGYGLYDEDCLDGG